VELVTVAPDAVQRFAKILADEGVEVDGDLTESAVEYLDRDGGAEREQASEDRPVGEAGLFADEGSATEKLVSKYKGAASTAAVIVDAPVDVIARVLHRAESQPELFSAVKVDARSRAAAYGVVGDSAADGAASGQTPSLALEARRGFGSHDPATRGEGPSATDASQAAAGSAVVPGSAAPQRLQDKRRSFARARIVELYGYRSTAGPAGGGPGEPVPNRALSAGAAAPRPPATVFYFTLPEDAAREAAPVK
jgi:hypothetical protein